MTLGEAAGEAMDSDHWDAALAFCEGLLPPPGGGGEGEGRGAAEDLARTLRRAMGGPFRGGWGDDDDDDDDDNDDEEEEDWFDHFPPEARPSDAVVLAGEGATSTLHRDPFEWTGTSLCLEGSKLWRFVLPGGGGVEEVDGALESYRLASVAWDDGGGGDGGTTTAAATTTPLSAGWQSDLTLYRHRAGGVPPARALAGLAGSDPAAYVRELEATAPGGGARRAPGGGAREARGRRGGGKHLLPRDLRRGSPASGRSAGHPGPLLAPDVRTGAQPRRGVAAVRGRGGRGQGDRACARRGGGGGRERGGGGGRAGHPREERGVPGGGGTGGSRGPVRAPFWTRGMRGGGGRGGVPLAGGGAGAVYKSSIASPWTPRRV